MKFWNTVTGNDLKKAYRLLESRAETLPPSDGDQKTGEKVNRALKAWLEKKPAAPGVER